MYSALPPVLLDLLRNPLLAIALPFVLGNISGLPAVVAVKGPWYNGLAAPPLRPSSNAFGPIWALLYCSMGYASHIAATAFDESPNLGSRKYLAYTGLGWYFVQLATNLSYTTVFFGWHQMLIGQLIMLVTTASAFAMTKDLHLATAGKTTWFLAPYCAYLVFASYLNLGYVVLNRYPAAHKALANGKGKAASKKKQITAAVTGTSAE